jgi:SAM-dependent methyltransferase
MPTADAKAYLDGPFQIIKGWCLPNLWQSIEPLYEQIVARGNPGPVAEIGVYQGKFFIGLVKTMGAPTNNYAIDVFDLQEFNLDKAGEGNIEALRANLRSSGVDDAAVEFLKTDSMWLNDGDIRSLRADTGGFSMFSVDGCHLAEHTVNDIHIAMELTRPDGIIFVDDYYNPNWPGVQEGVARLYFGQVPRFVPLLFSCNKLVLCNISFHARYLKAVRDYLAAHYPGARVKLVKRFGYDTLTVVPEAKIATPAT